MNEDNLKTSLFSPRQKQFLAFVCCFAGGLVLVCLVAGVIYFLNQLFFNFFRCNLVACSFRDVGNFAKTHCFFFWSQNLDWAAFFQFWHCTHL